MKDGIEKYVRVTPLDYAEVYKNLVGGIKSYCEKNHIKALVLGISGGIDSTVCAALCKQVDLPLIGISMPVLLYWQEMSSVILSRRLIFSQRLTR